MPSVTKINLSECSWMT